MAWFIAQSWIIILFSVLLGVFLGWLWWGRLWQAVRFSESEALKSQTRQHEDAIAGKDTEIRRLRAMMDAGTPDMADLLRRSGVENDLAKAQAAEAEPRERPEPTLTPRPTEISDSDIALVPVHPVAEDPDELSPVPAAIAPEHPGPRGTGSSPEPVRTAAPTPDPVGSPYEPTPEPVPGPAPAPPSGSDEDDLERIDGIGPRLHQTLNAAGIRTYRQLADADEDRLRSALQEQELTFAPSLTTWSRQAAFLAEGDEEGHRVFAAGLIAGREVPDDAHRPTSPTTSQEEPVGEVGAPTAGPPSSPAPAPTVRPSTEPEAAEPEQTVPLPARRSPARNGTENPPHGRPEKADQADQAKQDDQDEQDDRAEQDDQDEGDDLERIEGIGPRIAGALRTAGIVGYAELADSDIARLQAALEASNLRFAPSLPTWSRQARLLADGDEEGFRALARKLVIGTETPGNK